MCLIFLILQGENYRSPISFIPTSKTDISGCGLRCELRLHFKSALCQQRKTKTKL